MDEDTVERDLQDRYETLSEAVQTVMRRYGIPEPYEKLKEMTRGKAIEKSDMQKFVQNLNIPVGLAAPGLPALPLRAYRPCAVRGGAAMFLCPYPAV